MHAREYDAHTALREQAAQTPREAWGTAQFVDDIIDFLKCGGDHGEAQRRMTDRLLPVAIQRRILAGGGAIRHQERKPT